MKKLELYIYLVERITDKKKFVMYGNTKPNWYGLTNLFELEPENCQCVTCHYGNRGNITTDLCYDNRHYQIINQEVANLR